MNNVCSECDLEGPIAWDFCPRCGAKMDLRVDVGMGFDAVFMPIAIGVVFGAMIILFAIASWLG